MAPERSDWNGLSVRVRKLEKENRRLKRIGAMALVMVASVFVMGQAAPKKTVEANEFILKDPSGKERGRFDLGNNGPELTLLDQNGKDRISLQIFDLGEAAKLLLKHANGESAAELGVYELFGSGQLSLIDKSGKHHVWLDASPNNSFIGASGEDLKYGASLSETKLELFDKEGFMTSIGATDLVNPRTGETAKTSASSVVLFDKDKKVLWKAP